MSKDETNTDEALNRLEENLHPTDSEGREALATVREELIKRPTLEESIANVNFWKDKTAGAEARVRELDEELSGCGHVKKALIDEADACRERMEAAEAHVARWQEMARFRRERQKAADARARELEDGLREIEELCNHWELHDKTDPDEHDRWRKAAIARAKMVGDKARALLVDSEATP